MQHVANYLATYKLNLYVYYCLTSSIHYSTSKPVGGIGTCKCLSRPTELIIMLSSASPSHRMRIMIDAECKVKGTDGKPC